MKMSKVFKILISISFGIIMKKRQGLPLVSRSSERSEEEAKGFSVLAVDRLTMAVIS